MPASKISCLISVMTSAVTATSSPALETLDALGKSLLEQSLMSVTTVADWKPHQAQ